MIPRLRGKLMSLIGQTPADDQDSGWRRVPKINLLPGTRSSVITPLVLFLVAVMLLEALALQYLYRDGLSTNERSDALGRELSDIERRISAQEGAIADEEGKIAELENGLKQLAAQDEVARQAYDQLTALRPDWGASLEALLQGDSPDAMFTKVVTAPGGKIDVTGVATGVAGIDRFLEHMREVDYILDLTSFRWEEGESSLVFTADIRTR